MSPLGPLDLRMLQALYGGASGAWAPAMIAFTVLGSGWSAVGLVPMLYHPRTRRFAVALAVAIATQATLVWWLKRVVGRVRPWIALGLPTPIGAPRDGSFPSGHAAASFCVAAFLAVALPAVWSGSRGRARALVAGTLVVAAFVASSRVYLGAHFPGDVLCGSALGALVGVVAGRACLAWHAPLRAPRAADGPVEGEPERG